MKYACSLLPACWFDFWADKDQEPTASQVELVLLLILKGTSVLRKDTNFAAAALFKAQPLKTGRPWRPFQIFPMVSQILFKTLSRLMLNMFLVMACYGLFFLCERLDEPSQSRISWWLWTSSLWCADTRNGCLTAAFGSIHDCEICNWCSFWEYSIF